LWSEIKDDIGTNKPFRNRKASRNPRKAVPVNKEISHKSPKSEIEERN
jgi:hypothetical protein